MVNCDGGGILIVKDLENYLISNSYFSSRIWPGFWEFWVSTDYDVVLRISDVGNGNRRISKGTKRLRFAKYTCIYIYFNSDN